MPIEQSIELDCAPGNPRPDDLLPQVIRETGLALKEPISKWCGNWRWDYSEVKEETWKELQPILAQRIIELYNKNLIRYGSW
jgi:hypothetical protein